MVQGIDFGKPVRITAAGTAKTGQGRLWRVLVVGGSGDSSATIYDNTSATGDPIIEVNALTAQNGNMDFFKENGIPFDTGLHVVPAGTGAVVYLWFK